MERLNLGEIIATTARHHLIALTPELYERCFWELERSGDSHDEVVDALLRGFNAIAAAR